MKASLGPRVGAHLPFAKPETKSGASSVADPVVSFSHLQMAKAVASSIGS